MFEEIGHHVEKIRRVGYGPLVLDVPPGEVRDLSEAEVESLRRAARPKSAKVAVKTKPLSKAGPEKHAKTAAKRPAKRPSKTTYRKSR
jgi:23S rRNA pseudouridine2605 synthase